MSDDFLTWNGDSLAGEPPRRPSTDDCGGDQKADDLEYPPDPVEHPTAAGWNQKVRQIVALAKVSPACLLEVRFDGGGVPYVARFSSPSSLVGREAFDVTHNSTGDVTVTWPANTWPASVVSPSGLTVIAESSDPCFGHVQEVTDGVRVRTFEGGAGADLAWTLHLN